MTRDDLKAKFSRRPVPLTEAGVTIHLMPMGLAETIELQQWRNGLADDLTPALLEEANLRLFLASVCDATGRLLFAPATRGGPIFTEAALDEARGLSPDLVAAVAKKATEINGLAQQADAGKVSTPS